MAEHAGNSSPGAASPLMTGRMTVRLGQIRGSGQSNKPPKTLAQFWDADGSRYGIPTYPFRMAPAGLATMRQLTALGLRPGGQDVRAQIMWRARGGRTRVAYLYAIADALPKRIPSAGQLAALDRAMAARRLCPECGLDAGYCLPTRYGMCWPCAQLLQVA